MSILQSIFEVYHSVHWGTNSTQKHHPLFSANPLLKSLKCSSLVFRQFRYTFVFYQHPPAPKNHIFSMNTDNINIVHP